MYTRQITEPPKNLIHKGRALFGTYSDTPRRIDIKGMKAPYAGFPIPAFISNIRVKSHLFFTFSLGDFIGQTEFFDFKLYGLAEVIFWNTRTGKKYAYHTYLPPGRRYIPKNTDTAACVCYRKARQIKISWKNGHNAFRMEFNVHGDKIRPSAYAVMHSRRQDSMKSSVLFVNPSPASNRCTATWLSTMEIKGRIYTTNMKTGTQTDKTTDTGLALFMMNRSYYKFHTERESVTGIGSQKVRNQDGTTTDRKIIFKLEMSNLDAADPDKANSNILVIDGKQTLLPSVFITHSFGIDKKWIIQDTESMVDLSFTPASVSTRILNIFVMRNAYATIYGTFDGVLLTSDGQKITLKNFPGLVYKSRIRT